MRSANPTIPTLQRAASQLTPKLDDLHADALSRLYTLKTFRDRLGPLCLPNVTLSERDCRVLATYLSRKGVCGFDGEVSSDCFRRFCEPKYWPKTGLSLDLLRTGSSGLGDLTHIPSQVIKFLPPHATPTPSQPVPITAADRSTLSLLASVASLSASISSLEGRITAARNKAAGYAAQKRVELAKAALVEKRRDEKLLEERVGQRLKVQEVVSAIERAVGDEEVSVVLASVCSGRASSGTNALCRLPRCYVGDSTPSPCSSLFITNPRAQTLSALTLGTSTLRTVLSSPTLQLDNISELTSALDEQLVSAQEVSEAVDAVSAPERDALNDEVEAEWERLVKEEGEREDRQRIEEAKRKLETPAPVPASTSPAEEVEAKTEASATADEPSKEPAVPAQ